MMRTNPLDVFGGEESVRHELLRAIRVALRSAELQPYELGVLAGLEDPRLAGKIEDGSAVLTGEVALSLMTPLGIPIDAVLQPAPELTNEEREYWGRQRCERKAGPVWAAEGTIEIDPELILGLFLRLEAIRALK